MHRTGQDAIPLPQVFSAARIDLVARRQNLNQGDDAVVAAVGSARVDELFLEYRSISTEFDRRQRNAMGGR